MLLQKLLPVMFFYGVIYLEVTLIKIRQYCCAQRKHPYWQPASGSHVIIGGSKDTIRAYTAKSYSLWRE